MVQLFYLKVVIEKSYSLLKRGGVMVVEVPNDFNPLQKIIQKGVNFLL